MFKYLMLSLILVLITPIGAALAEKPKTEKQLQMEHEEKVTPLFHLLNTTAKIESPWCHEKVFQHLQLKLLFFPTKEAMSVWIDKTNPFGRILSGGITEEQVLSCNAHWDALFKRLIK